MKFSCNLTFFLILKITQEADKETRAEIDMEGKKMRRGIRRGGWEVNSSRGQEFLTHCNAKLWFFYIYEPQN